MSGPLLDENWFDRVTRTYVLCVWNVTLQFADVYCDLKRIGEFRRNVWDFCQCCISENRFSSMREFQKFYKDGIVCENISPRHGWILASILCLFTWSTQYGWLVQQSSTSLSNIIYSYVQAAIVSIKVSCSKFWIYRMGVFTPTQ